MNGFPLIQLVAGSSLRLRDAMVAAVVAGWSGPVRRSDAAATDLRNLLPDLDTPPLFGEPELILLRADALWLRRSAAALRPLVGRAPVAGVLVVTTASLTPPGKAKDDEELKALIGELDAAGLLKQSETPWAHAKPWEVDGLVRGWLVERFAQGGVRVERPGEVAAVLVERVGDDPDGLLGAIELLGVAAGDEAVTAQLARDLLGVTAERPAWDIADAVLAGNARRAIDLLHAGAGMEPAQALAVLTSEVRKMIACAELEDDAAVHKALLSKSRSSLAKARRQASAIGKARLLRLLAGCLQAGRDLRGSGVAAELVFERLVLHARMVLPSR